MRHIEKILLWKTLRCLQGCGTAESYTSNKKLRSFAPLDSR